MSGRSHATCEDITHGQTISDPFAVDEAARLIAAIHGDWGEAQGNYDEFRFFTGRQPSEEIALLISDATSSAAY